jgi:hypothetical protein
MLSAGNTTFLVGDWARAAAHYSAALPFSLAAGDEQASADTITISATSRGVRARFDEAEARYADACIAMRTSARYGRWQWLCRTAATSPTTVGTSIAPGPTTRSADRLAALGEHRRPRTHG